MAFKLKSRREIELMRQAGRIVYTVLKRLQQITVPGVTTAELDAEAERICSELGGTCLFKGVPGRSGPFPGAICCSVNEQVVHGIPGPRVIQPGDLVSIDFGARLHGYCGDAATTILVEPVSDKVRRLAETTSQCLDIAIAMARPGERWSNIAEAMQRHAERQGYSVVRQFVGHGIGTEMHEDPKVPNFVSESLRKHDIILREGLVLAVEPMVNMGRPGVVVEDDGWTVVTEDGLPAAHFEHMLAITADGVDVLTDGR